MENEAVIELKLDDYNALLTTIEKQQELIGQYETLIQKYKDTLITQNQKINEVIDLMNERNHKSKKKVSKNTINYNPFDSKKIDNITI